MFVQLVSGNAKAFLDVVVGRSHIRSSWTAVGLRPLYKSAVSGNHPILPDDCEQIVLLIPCGYLHFVESEVEQWLRTFLNEK